MKPSTSQYELPPNQTEPFFFRLPSIFLYTYLFNGTKNGSHQVLDAADPQNPKSCEEDLFMEDLLMEDIFVATKKLK